MKISSSSFASFKRLLNYSAKYKKDFRLGTLFSILNKAFDVAPEILIGIAIDVVANQEQSFLAKFGIVDSTSQLILLSVLTLVIWICESIFEYLLLIKWRGLAQSLQHELRAEAYNHIQKLDMAYFEDKHTGGLVAILNDDVNQLERFLNGGINSLIQVFTSVVLIGGVFFAIAPNVAVFAFLPIPIILWGAIVFQKKAAPLYLNVRDKAALIGGRLANNIAGMTTIRSFNATEAESINVISDSHNYLNANRGAIRVSSAFNPLIRMAVLSGFLATFVLGGKMALDGDLNIGLYGVLVFLTQRLLWPLRDLADTFDLFERAMASADRVLNLLNAPIKLEEKKAPLSLDTTQGVSIKNLGFEYIPGFPILDGVNIEVPPGKTVAIVGPTGSGKSTITRLLLKFYDFQKGDIQFLGKNLRDIDADQVRQNIGLVSQDVFLFPGSILENILYGNPQATRAEVEAVARQAHAWEFIEKLPQGLDTLIGERGQKLSGGQRQRICLARVILKNPSVMILDEATSAVDNETEALIQSSLAEATKNRTTIVIAHRLSTVLNADIIYVLAKGRVVEMGTHAELLEQRNFYYQLWQAPHAQ